MAKLRIALTISGAVALGAYEGGVLAALLSAIEPLAQGSDPQVRIDAIGGASAGSVTGLLAARCLSAGTDPVRVMREAWVIGDSIQRMVRGLQDAPLSTRRLRDMAVALLASDPTGSATPHQEVPIRMVMVLACLRGLSYNIMSGSQPDAGIPATTFVDLATVTIEPGQSVAELTEPTGASPIDLALASAANAFGFAPELIDRAVDAAGYRAQGTELPSSGALWYTDGGTLDNEPLGHTLDLVDELDRDAGGDFNRLHLLIHPHPTGAPAGSAWSDPANPPTWVSTLLRADHLQRTQSLYDDLRRVEKTNTRIAWLNQLDAALAPVFADLRPSEQERLTGVLRATLESIDRTRQRFGSHNPAEPVPDYAGDSAQELMMNVVSRVAGVTGKRSVGLDVISPLALATAAKRSVEDMLAGEVLMHFGGFFDRRFRQSDFDLGYQSALEWMGRGMLSHHGLDVSDERSALAAATRAYEPSDKWRKWGTKTVGYLARRHPLAMASVVGQLTRVVGRDAVLRHPQ